MTAAIHVCPLSRLAATLSASGARSVVTLMAGPYDLLPAMAGLRHLVLDMSDITARRAGHVLPTGSHVTDLLAFVRGWDRQAPLLIHCYAGVSRSTAAAFAAACALRPEAAEAAIARDLRAASPVATPNPRIVALADAALGRQGRMIAAVAAIGRGQDGYEGNVFKLDVPDAPEAQAKPEAGCGKSVA